MSIPAWAVRGARVVCVSVPTCPPSLLGMIAMPVVGETYTLRRVKISVDDKPYVQLAEIVNASIRYEDDRYIFNGEPQFGLRNFRPLVSIKTQEQDVADFRKLLTQPIPEAV